MSKFAGLVPSYIGEVTCDNCGNEAYYTEYIVAEGYPDAHIEYEVLCTHCGEVEYSSFSCDK